MELGLPCHSPPARARGRAPPRKSWADSATPVGLDRVSGRRTSPKDLIDAVLFAFLLTPAAHVRGGHPALHPRAGARGTACGSPADRSQVYRFTTAATPAAGRRMGPISGTENEAHPRPGDEASRPISHTKACLLCLFIVQLSRTCPILSRRTPGRRHYDYL